MHLEHSILPLAAVLVSLLAAIPIILSDRRPNLREMWTLLAGVSMFLIVASMVPTVLAGNQPTITLFEVIPGVPIQLRVDSMGMLFALIASFLFILTSIYSIGYMRSLQEHDQTRYFASFAVAIGATVGVAFSANLLTLYLFYEMLSLSTYPLVAHERNAESRSSGRRYLSILLGTSVGFALPAMMMTYAFAGTLDFTVGGILGGAAPPAVLSLMLVMLVAGFAKCGVMPFHGWLPAAMVAPTPVSSFLHGVAVVKVGVFSVLRVLLDIFGIDVLGAITMGAALPYFVSFTIIAASIVALSQDNLKRRLAYSTVGQLSYIMLGVSLLSPAAVTGGIMHIASHAFAKVTLFYCAGAIYVASHKKYISQMKGLGRTMPFTFGAFGIAALSMIGAPPSAGFVSKWLMLNGALDADMIIIFGVLLSSTLLNAAYFVPIVYQGFFGKPNPEGDLVVASQIKEAPLTLLVPLMITSIISLLIGIYPYFFLQFAEAVLP